ncbi:MAG: pseudaminic acid cytidylyltransferase [Paludibacteraceae bacterium]|nr:pseudaminic acid cytidylyltransferase [Paludibacteraceae bacterium]
MKNLAIIPARGGSKRIPHKNIKEFLSKPIIAYSIETALKCGLFYEVMVSTDDEQIAEIAKQYGASVPFLRSAETADDFATTRDVLNEVVSEYQKRGQEFDAICCIYATAPLIAAEDIVEAYKTLSNSDFACVYPVVEFSYPIWRCLDVAEDGSMKRHWPEYENSRSQDLPKEYHDSGTFYWHRIADGKIANGQLGAIIMPEERVQDIDTDTDWKLAEMKYQLLNGK